MSARTIVVGGGLAGLAAAARLVAAGVEVLLLESSSALGGVVGSVAQDGFLFERAPHTVLAGSPTFRRVVDELGLSHRLERADPAARTRWLWRGGRLRALPATPLQILSTDLLSSRGKLALLREPMRRFVAPSDGAREPTFGEFLDERIGAEASRLLAGAFVRGVHAAELDELGARSAFPRVWDLAARNGSILRGLAARAFAKREPLPGPDLPRSSLVSFPNGMQELVDGFAAALGRRVLLGARATGIERFGTRWIVRTENGFGHVADEVVIAVPAPAAARLLAEIDSALAAIAGVRHARIVLVGLGFAPGALDALPHGFGFLVPPIEDGRDAPAPRALGTIFLTNLFPNRAPRGARSVASFYRAADVAGLDDRALVELARADLELAIGAPVAQPRTARVERWDDVIPRHAPGHADRVASVRARLRERAPGLHLAGAWVGGVSVEQVLTAGRACADQILKDRRELE